MRSSLCWLALSAAFACTAPDADAQAPVRIGVLTGMSELNSDYTGLGSVEAARMAVDDCGGLVLGRPLELLSADHQDKPDVGSAIAMRWLPTEGFSAIVDIPSSSVGLAVQYIARRAGKVALFDMYLLSMKSPVASKEPWDYEEILRSIPEQDAFRPLSQSQCPLVRQ